MSVGVARCRPLRRSIVAAPVCRAVEALCRRLRPVIAASTVGTTTIIMVGRLAAATTIRFVSDASELPGTVGKRRESILRGRRAV